jgi:hypothetical protein
MKFLLFTILLLNIGANQAASIILEEAKKHQPELFIIYM